MREKGNMENRKVGVYTRIFRSEATIGRAIESVLNQTYKNLNYYILVNDMTKAEVEKVVGKDERVKILCCRPGDKFSFVYQAKRMAADGNDYMASLDADDWYEAHWLESMVYFMEENSLDVAACGSRFVEAGGKTQGYRGIAKDFCVEMNQFPRYFPELYQFCRANWGKLYSRRIIVSCDLENFPKPAEYGDYGGDTIFVLEALKGADRFGVSAKILHNYQVSAQSSSHTYFAEGRLHSDELLFRIGENFLKRYGEVSKRNEEFLYAVYAFAVQDTVKMVQKNMKEEEQAKVYNDIFNNELTKKAMLLDRDGRLTGVEKGRFVHYMTNLILKALSCLDDEQVHSDIAFWCQLLSAQDVLLRYVLQDIDFIRNYPVLVLRIANNDRKEAMELCEELSNLEEGGFYQERLIEILLDLAALLGDTKYFIRGKYKKMQYALKKKDIPQAKQEYHDLLEMGIMEEKLRGCLSESDKNIIGAY